VSQNPGTKRKKENETEQAAENGMAARPQLPSIDDQRQFWNWHWQNWEQRKVLNDWTERRATEILGLIKGLPIQRPRILDLGCGRGWFTERLADLGEAHGIDLSPEGIAAAQARRPDITYLAGNIYEAALPEKYFDVVVSQEVIAHVEDQPKYVERGIDVLKPGGYFIITTGNKWVMDRLGNVGWNVQPKEHIAHQLSQGQLRKMLAPRCDVLKAFTIIPHGQLGVLRVINSYKLNSMLAKVVSPQKIDALKEKAGFGWQMIFLAQKRA
jgi:2-polyprenyl-3-methyl-5-hydroxy-6-metoxy-1,4-benzoquinol methylase